MNDDPLGLLKTEEADPLGLLTKPQKGVEQEPLGLLKPVEKQQKEPGFFERSLGENIQTSIKRNIQQAKALPKTALNLATGIVSFPFMAPQWAVGMQEKYAGEPYKGLLTKKLPSGKTIAETSQKIGETIQKISEPKTEAEKEQVDLINLPFKGLAKAGEISGGLTKTVTGSPSAATLVEAGINLLPLFVGGPGKKLLFEKVTPKKIGGIIEKGIEKGIRPSTAGKRTFPQMKRYFEKAESAVKSILENKKNLEFTDEVGGIIKDQLPQNLKQFSQAIDQTKRSVFDRYDTLRKTAGKKGAEINLKPINKELELVAQNTALTDMAPQTANYAWNMAQKLLARKKYTTAEAQEAITLLNRNLEAFYKSPTYETAGKAYIDSLIANNLRKSLDSVIEKTVEPGYQNLKREYGALKEIERDVNQRAIVDARKNIKGLLDFSDIFSGYHVIKGILSMNPSTIGAGAAAKIVAALYKLKNDPNRIVRKMFSESEKVMAGKKVSIRNRILEKAIPFPPRLTVGSESGISPILPPGTSKYEEMQSIAPIDWSKYER